MLKKFADIWYSVVVFCFGLLIGIAFFDQSSRFIGNWLFENTDRMLGLGGLMVGIIGVGYGWRADRIQLKQKKEDEARQAARQDLVASRCDITLKVNTAAGYLGNYVFFIPAIYSEKGVDFSDINEEQRQQRQRGKEQHQEFYDLFKHAYQDAIDTIARYDNKDKHSQRAQEILFTLDMLIDSFARESYTCVGQFNHLIKIGFSSSNETDLVKLFGLDKETRIIEFIKGSEIQTKIEDELRLFERLFPFDLE